MTGFALTRHEILARVGPHKPGRKTRGDHIDAACGQLAGEVDDRTRIAERSRAPRSVTLRIAS